MSISTYIKSHAVLAGTIAIVVVISMVIAGRVASRSTATESNDNTRKVTLVDASSFRGDTAHVSADGIVESVSQVDLKSQISAPLSAINVAVGDSVYAGQTIATLQNADIRAQLDQAKAALVIAQGQYSSGSVSLESARRTAIDKVRDAYTKADDAVHSQIDTFLLNGSNPDNKIYSVILNESLSSKIRTTRIDLLTIFPDWNRSIATLTTASTDAEMKAAIALSQKNVDIIKGLLENISLALSEAARISSGSGLATINGWQALTAGAHSSMSAASASLIAADGALANAAISQGTSGNGQISAAQAGVKNLEAQLAKTIIISPISGKIAALPLRTGELASPGQLIATVVGQGGLNIKAYVSGEDFTKVRAGAKVLIKGTVSGTVSSVAPSLNQANKKVEVKIAVLNPESSGLVVGQNVSASITVTESVPSEATTATKAYMLPIQNVKIIPGDAYVFTVDENSKVVRHPVTLGKVEGGFVEVTAGITDDMRIVSPVYELEEGDLVTVR